MHPKPISDQMVAQILSPDFKARFYAKVNQNGPTPAHVAHLGNCWEWTASIHATGYGSVHVTSNGESRGLKSHRVAWIMSTGGQPSQNVLHKCDNRKCVRPDHLFDGSYLENNLDSLRKGRIKKKLSTEDVEYIRQAIESGTKQRDLANRFGVSNSLICNIRMGRNRKHTI